MIHWDMLVQIWIEPNIKIECFIALEYFEQWFDGIFIDSTKLYWSKVHNTCWTWMNTPTKTEMKLWNTDQQRWTICKQNAFYFWNFLGLDRTWTMRCLPVDLSQQWWVAFWIRVTVGKGEDVMCKVFAGWTSGVDDHENKLAEELSHHIHRAHNAV